MTRFTTIAAAIVFAGLVCPALAAGQGMPGLDVGWARDEIGANRPVFDVPPARSRAHGAGLDQVSKGLQARDEGRLDKACKHFRKAQRHFRAAGDVADKEWSARLAEETCPKT